MAQQQWRFWRTFPGGPPYVIAFQADSHGRVYGWVPGGLTRLVEPSQSTPLDFPVPGLRDPFPIQVTERSAFAVSANDDDALSAFVSRDGGEWQHADGFPNDVRLADAVGRFSVAALEPDRALVVWTGSHAGQSGLWASVIH